MNNNSDFMGVYVLPEREIILDSHTSNEDLRLVIRNLSEEIKYMRSELRAQSRGGEPHG